MSGNLKAPNRPNRACTPNFSQSALAAAIAGLTLGLSSAPTMAAVSTTPASSTSANKSPPLPATIDDDSDSKLWQQAKEAQRQGYQTLTPAQIEREIANSQNFHPKNGACRVSELGLNLPMVTAE